MAVVSILFFVIVVLLTYILILKKEVRSIRRQLQERLTGIEKSLDVSLIDRDIIALASDINESIAYQKESSLEVLKQERQLKEAISNISHDLRTPLTSIIGYLQLLTKTELTPEQKEFIDTALSRSEDLRHLIVQFYELSVWESKDTTPSLKRVNIDNLLTNIILSYTEQFKKQGVVPNLKTVGDATFVIADEGMLKRVIDNLVSNAITYGETSFQVTVNKTDKNIHIVFENDISDDHMIEIERLFDKFYTRNVARNNSGTGLGLYIVKLLVEKMNGLVTASRSDNVLRIVLIMSDA